MKNKKIYGLIGKNINYSYSKEYFTKKFYNEKILNTYYELFNISDIRNFIFLVKKTPELLGLNVTIPYKEKIIPYLNDIKDDAKKIKVVNTIKIYKNRYIGYNTDIYGFKKSFEKKLLPNHKNALILGTGGAAKSVNYVLNKMGIYSKFVSRNNKKNYISYNSINKYTLEKYQIIINCTPIGTYPYIKSCPLIPYEYINESHYLYDLVYNPLESAFLKKGIEKKAVTKNGLDMLYLQAEYSWKIWNIKN